MKKEYQKNESVRKFLSDPSLYAFVLLFCYALVIYPGCIMNVSGLAQDGREWVVAAPPNGCAGRYYSYNANQLSIYSLTPPIRYEVSSGMLPDGLSIDENTGIISGIPAEPGRARFVITVYDSGVHAADYRPPAIEIAIWMGNFEFITPRVLPLTCLDEIYSAPIEICGGEPEFTWGISGWDPVEQPLSFRDETTVARLNRIQGTPNQKDDYNLFVTASHRGGSHTKRYDLNFARKSAQ